jgi:hypothetical protein
MRTYGRVGGTGAWTVVETDADGFNDYVYVATLGQCLKLNLNESPFYSSYGIPAKPAVIQQVFPDFYVQMTQQSFAPYFASLIIAKQQSATPTYRVDITTQQGVKVPTLSVGIPQ